MASQKTKIDVTDTERDSAILEVVEKSEQAPGTEGSVEMCCC